MSFFRPMRSLRCLPLGIFAALACVAANAQSYTTIVVFGDSLSDTGNVAHLTQQHYLLRYPSPLFNYTDGRFTDGPDTNPAAHAYQGVWVEQMARAFTTPPAIKNSLDGGTNYAFGDATTMDGTRTIMDTVAGAPVSITIDDMGQQVTNYLATAPTAPAATLYILFGGANDLYADFSPASITATAQRETALVQRLVNAGGTDFLVPNLPPLGGIPSHATDPNAPALNAAAASFKAQLAADLQALVMSATAQGKTIHVFQPDIFTNTASAAANPMPYAVANVTAPAQGISGDPDTYFIWDGVHPTTTGHHFLAAASENTLRPLAADPFLRFFLYSNSLLSNTIVAGQAVTLSIQFTPPPGPPPGFNTPNGLITFFSGSGTTATAIASAALDSAGNATATFTPASAAGSPYTITAVYAGDTTYLNSSLPPQTLTVLASPVATTTTLTSSNLNVNQGDPVTLTATVTSASGTPSGAVTFLDGTATLGTGTLNSAGVATLLLSTLSTPTLTGLLSAGTHTITASYAANGIYGASTSAAITQKVIAPSLDFTLAPATLTLPSGGSAATTLTFISTGGFAGTAVPVCQKLPAHFACSFASPAVISPGGSTAVTLSVSTGNPLTALSPAFRQSGQGSGTSSLFYAVTLFPLLGLGAFAGRGRRALSRAAFTVLAATFATCLALGLTGCFGGASTSNNAAPGTYTIAVGYTINGTASATTHPLTVTVQ